MGTLPIDMTAIVDESMYGLRISKFSSKRSGTDTLRSSTPIYSSGNRFNNSLPEWLPVYLILSFSNIVRIIFILCSPKIIPITIRRSVGNKSVRWHPHYYSLLHLSIQNNQILCSHSNDCFQCIHGNDEFHH